MNNLKIRKESPNSSLEEKKKPKTPNATTHPHKRKGKRKKIKKNEMNFPPQ